MKETHDESSSDTKPKESPIFSRPVNLVLRSHSGIGSGIKNLEKMIKDRRMLEMSNLDNEVVPQPTKLPRPMFNKGKTIRMSIDLEEVIMSEQQ